MCKRSNTSGCIKKVFLLFDTPWRELCHVIMHHILRLSIYVFHTNKDQAFRVSNATFLVSLRSKIANYLN
jgi:hypothetical protein